MGTQTIRISADSTCDLSPALVSRYHIAIAPLQVIVAGKPYLDGVEIDPDRLFAMVEKTGKIGSTTAVNLDEYLAFFRAQRKGFDAEIHFTISSEMSSCFQNACAAAAELGNVYVIDSRNLSTGIGQLVLDAAGMASEGFSAEEIVRRLEEKKAKLDVSFVLDTLDYLRRGGRCSTVAALGANLLKLKPCIQVTEGAMGVGKKYRGTLESAFLNYVHDKLAQPDTVDPGRIFITHSGVDAALVEKVKAAVLECVPFREVHITRAGCTISNHCGPNCLGILFYRK
ncbi:MAG: DegV family protein [Clostridia bacterium]|nr:DegV family protein [Clostridia bacterium]